MNRNYRPPELTETAGGVNEGNYAPSEPELYLNLGAVWDVPFLTGIRFLTRG
jgi:iron complex outermembrane receptor protein